MLTLKLIKNEFLLLNQVQHQQDENIKINLTIDRLSMIVPIFKQLKTLCISWTLADQSE